MRHRTPALLAPLFALILSACAAAPAGPDGPAAGAAPAPEPVVLRGELDSRAYRYLELPNRLRVLLVSDPATDKSAASLRVTVGSGDDPPGRQGLAHFLEHMLFLGTARYPDAGEYQAFINAHGGSHNAYTAVDHTHYFFDIEPGSLESALDRFSQFFVAPLFNPGYVQREMNAVDSEYRMGLKDDARREYDVLRELVQPGHPLAKLAVGNLETLGADGGDIREDLLSFYRTHYSANRMTLVVLGREPLEALEAMVRPRFTPVEDRDTAPLSGVPALFAPGKLPLEVRIRPEKEQRELSLMFPVPSSRARPAAKPLEYIANLLGHEGPGGLLSLLKERGLAEGLSAGAGFDMFGQDAFQLTVQLTPAGLARRDEIVALAFRAIDALRESGVEAWRYREQAQLAELGFRFREKGSPSATVIGIANALDEYPVAEALRGPFLFADFDAALIGDYLGWLRPGNLLLTLSAREVDVDRESRWFGTPYALRPLDAAAIEAAAAALAPPALPAPNEFVPERVGTKPLEPGAGPVPALLAQERAYRLWHLQDAAFPSPKASVYLQLLSDEATAGPREAALLALFARLVQDELNEFAYPATLAGLQYAVAPSARGLTVKLSGYDDRQGRLLARILASLAHSRFAPERFESLKAELLREWGNSTRERPFLQLIDALGNTMVRRSWPELALRDALAPAGADELAAFAARLRAGAAVEVLVHGNVLRAEALGLGAAVRDALRGPQAADVPAIEVLELPVGERSGALAVDHPDSALLMYLQGAGTSETERALVALTAQILAPDFFDQLRTERQLGYAVFAQPYPLARAPGLLLAVQSPVAAPGALAAEFEAFLQRRLASLDALDEAAFARQRATLAERLRERPKSLSEKSERLWSDLGLGSFGFDDRERVAQAVEGLSREAWVAFYRAQVAGPSRRALLLYSTGAAHAGRADPAVPGAAVHAPGAWSPDAKYYRFEWPLTVQDPGGALHLKAP